MKNLTFLTISVLASGGLLFGSGCNNNNCGDYQLDSGEQCDDGNLFDGDGCSSYCTVENGFGNQFPNGGNGYGNNGGFNNGGINNGYSGGGICSTGESLTCNGIARFSGNSPYANSSVYGAQQNIYSFVSQYPQRVRVHLHGSNDQSFGNRNGTTMVCVSEGDFNGNCSEQCIAADPDHTEFLAQPGVAYYVRVTNGNSQWADNYTIGLECSGGVDGNYNVNQGPFSPNGQFGRTCQNTNYHYGNIAYNNRNNTIVGRLINLIRSNRNKRITRRNVRSNNRGNRY